MTDDVDKSFANVTDTDVFINWDEVERQRSRPYARLLLAVRDGTWKRMNTTTQQPNDAVYPGFRGNNES